MTSSRDPDQRALSALGKIAAGLLAKSGGDLSYGALKGGLREAMTRDPLDSLVLCQAALVPLSMVRCRAIGVLPMRDDKGADDKIIAIAIDDPQFASYGDIAELPPHLLDELKRCFLDYKVLERKEVSIEAIQGHAEAERVIEEAIRLYGERREALLQ